MCRIFKPNDWYPVTEYDKYGIRRNKKRELFYKPEKVWYNETKL